MSGKLDCTAVEGEKMKKREDVSGQRLIDKEINENNKGMFIRRKVGVVMTEGKEKILRLEIQ